MYLPRYFTTHCGLANGRIAKLDSEIEVLQQNIVNTQNIIGILEKFDYKKYFSERYPNVESLVNIDESIS